MSNLPLFKPFKKKWQPFCFNICYMFQNKFFCMNKKKLMKKKPSGSGLGGKRPTSPRLSGSSSQERMRKTKTFSLLPKDKESQKEFKKVTLKISENSNEIEIKGTILVSLGFPTQPPRFMFDFTCASQSKEENKKYSFTTIISKEPGSLKDIPFPYSFCGIRVEAPFSIISITISTEHHNCTYDFQSRKISDPTPPKESDK